MQLGKYQQETNALNDNPLNSNQDNVILQHLKSDYNSCKHYESIWKDQIIRWKKEYNGEPYGNEVKGKSAIVSRDIKKYSEWLQANVLDPFISTPDIVKCYPMNPQSVRSAKAAEIVLNTQFCRQFNRFSFLAKAIKTLDREGTCVLKVGWEYAEEERDMVYTYQQPKVDENNQLILDEQGQPLIEEIKETKKEIVSLINRPTVMLCRNEDIFIDPTCLGEFDNAQFIIHRFETDLSTLKTDGRYKNIDKLNMPVKDPEYDRKGMYFEFTDKPRRKFVVYEYWGNYDMNGDGIAEPIVCAWVDDIIIRLEENPYPDKKPPFIVTPFLPFPFQVRGESNGELLSDIQKLKTAILRGFIDNMANSNNGQIAYKKGALDEVNRRRMLAGENFEFNGHPQDLFIGSYNQLPSSAFDFLSLLSQEADSLTGINVFGNNQTNSLIGQSGASSRGVIDGGNLRKLMVVRNIAENMLKPLFRKWLELNAELLGDETLFRLSNDTFELIRRDDLYGAIDIDLSISTSEDNAMKNSELGFILQTIGPNEDPEIRKLLLGKMIDNFREPELAEKIRNYVPQPDPLAVAKAQAEIENIQAQTQDLMASAGRTERDGDLKVAKINVEDAKAKLLGQQGNKASLDFYNATRGVDKLHELDKLDRQLDSQERIAKAKEEAKLATALLSGKLTGSSGESKKTPYSPSSDTPSNRNPYQSKN